MRCSELDQDDLLFHSTTTQLAITILRHGGLLPSQNGFISFTRDPNLWFGNDEVGGGQTQFVFDRSVLSRFAIEPYDCQTGGEDSEIEKEERIRRNRHRPLDVALANEIWTRDNSPLVNNLEDESRVWGLDVRRKS